MRISLLSLLITAALVGCGDGADRDGDGVGDSIDCNDEDPAISIFAAELCDGIDNDCDGSIDEDFDFDGDGTKRCDEDVDDCDDTDPDVGPDAEEVCDAIDNNCDGAIDEGFDADGDGWTTCAGDCDDGENTVGPNTAEECDGVDNDCNGTIDDGHDFDGDGVTRCGPDGVVGTADDDCFDFDAFTYPGATEQCDGQDNDCDGLPSIDEYDFDEDYWAPCEGDCDDEAWWISPWEEEYACDGIDNDCDDTTPDDGDADSDGFGLCDEDAWDCDDTDASIYPNAAEVCDDIDNDCDGYVDEDFDFDFDGVSTCGGDCDDNEYFASPDWYEICDGIDNNCDGAVDEDYDDTDKDFVADCLDSETTEADCADGFDNDGDGFADCIDPACVGVGTCTEEEVCANGGADDDGDGYADCFDDDCWGEAECMCDTEVNTTLDCTTNTIVYGELHPPAWESDMDAYYCSGDGGEGEYFLPGGEEFYAFTAPYDGRFTFEANAADADGPVMIMLLDGSQGCEVDACIEAYEYVWSDEFEWFADAGEELIIGVEAYWWESHRFTLEVAACDVPSAEVCDDDDDNDFDGDKDCRDTDCEGDPACDGQCPTVSFEMGCWDYTSFDIYDVGVDDFSTYGNECNSWGFYDYPEVVIEFTAPETGWVNSYSWVVGDHTVAVLAGDGNCDPEADCVGGGDWYGGYDPEYTDIFVEQGETYYFVIDSSWLDDSYGEFELQCDFF